MFFFQNQAVRIQFFLLLHIILIIANNDMRKIAKYLVALAAGMVFMVMSTGCLRQDYLMFEDGDFDGVEFSDYDLMHNAELDMDDADRD